MGAVETCQEKDYYKTKQVAKSKIRSSNRKWLEVYKCPVCSGWHLGHKRWKPKKAQSIEEYYNYIMELY